MTVLEVNTKPLDINTTNILYDLCIESYLICVGDKDHSYNLGELEAIDRLVSWIAQINYSQSEIEDQIAMFEDYAKAD